jgi:hypothetical protein
VSDVNIIIYRDGIFFYQKPPRKLLKLLKKYGIRFSTEVVYCG